jgi:hypothetical protein
VYTDDGSVLPCDAGTLLGCQGALGSGQSGMASFTNVPPGRYYLVVAGDQPDGVTACSTTMPCPGGGTCSNGTCQYSGTVDIAISGTPH